MTRFFAHYSEAEATWPRDRWPDFSPRELASKGEGELLVDEDALDRLQRMRTILGAPIMLTSAYRSPAHNTAIGGAPSSFHMKGRAFDVNLTGHNPAAVEYAARAAGFTAFGWYRANNFLHVDTGPERVWTPPRWYALDDAVTPLPIEQPLQPETATQDRDLIGTVAGGGGSVVAAGAVLSGIGSLAPAAQIIAIAGIVLALAGAAYVLRNRLSRLAR